MYTISDSGWLLKNGIEIPPNLVLIARNEENNRTKSWDIFERLQATENIRVIDIFLYDCMNTCYNRNDKSK